jgi:gluconokinase
MRQCCVPPTPGSVTSGDNPVHEDRAVAPGRASLGRYVSNHQGRKRLIQKPGKTGEAPVPMVIILMGVAGSGKTTVGEALARRLAWPFYDADDFHPAYNREKMRRGIPLDDNDRRPWLQALRAAIVRCVDAQQDTIFTCSALKQSYREFLTTDTEGVKFAYLAGSEQLIGERLRLRRGHFFEPKLLHSQFEELEAPAGVLTIDISPPPAAIVDSIIAALRLKRGRQGSAGN